MVLVSLLSMSSSNCCSLWSGWRLISVFFHYLLIMARPFVIYLWILYVLYYAPSFAILWCLRAKFWGPIATSTVWLMNLLGSFCCWWSAWIYRSWLTIENLFLFLNFESFLATSLSCTRVLSPFPIRSYILRNFLKSSTCFISCLQFLSWARFPSALALSCQW